MVNINDIQDLIASEARGTGRKNDPLVLCPSDIKAIATAGLIDGSGRIHMPTGLFEIEEDEDVAPMFSAD